MNKNNIKAIVESVSKNKYENLNNLFCRLLIEIYNLQKNHFTKYNGYLNTAEDYLMTFFKSFYSQYDKYKKTFEFFNQSENEYESSLDFENFDEYYLINYISKVVNNFNYNLQVYYRADIKRINHNENLDPVDIKQLYLNDNFFENKNIQQILLDLS